VALPPTLLLREKKPDVVARCSPSLSQILSSFEEIQHNIVESTRIMMLIEPVACVGLQVRLKPLRSWEVDCGRFQDGGAISGTYDLV
jgi:hypothetical protein